MTTTNSMSNPDGGDRIRDTGEAEVAILERNLNVLRLIVRACDRNDWSWVSVRYLLGEPGAKITEKDMRDAIKALIIKGVIEHRRGGIDENGLLSFGSGYGPTAAGKALAK